MKFALPTPNFTLLPGESLHPALKPEFTVTAETLRRLVAEFPDCKVIMLTSSRAPQDAALAFAAGKLTRAGAHLPGRRQVEAIAETIEVRALPA